MSVDQLSAFIAGERHRSLELIAQWRLGIKYFVNVIPTITDIEARLPLSKHSDQ